MLQQAKQKYLLTGMVLARPYVDVWIADAQTRQGQFQDAIVTLDALEEYTELSGEKYYDFAHVKARDQAMLGLTDTLMLNKNSL